LGHVFERSVIEEWIKKQGHVCPITMSPLSTLELAPDDELAEEIRRWQLRRDLDENTPKSPVKNVSNDAKVASPIAEILNPKNAEDDLYDF